MKGEAKQKTRPGFTLIELIMAMGLATVVLTGVLVLFSSSNKAYVTQDQVVSAQQNVRAAMEIMAHEARMAGYIPLDNLPGGAAVINTDVPGQSWSDGVLDRVEEATATTLTFVADLNTDNNAETVRYSLNGTTLTRQSWEWVPGTGWSLQAGGAVNLAEDVTGLTFIYTFANGVSGLPNDTDGDTTNDRNQVRAMSITMTGRTSAPVDGPNYRSRTLQTFLRMRNLGLVIFQ